MKLSLPWLRSWLQPSPHTIGKKGEQIACNYLKFLGMKLVDRNIKLRETEFDLIMLDGQTLVFVEVKTLQLSLSSTSSSILFPGMALTFSKQDRLIKGAKEYLQKIKLPLWPHRFDLVEIMLYPWGWTKVQHTMEAFCIEKRAFES